MTKRHMKKRRSSGRTQHTAVQPKRKRKQSLYIAVVVTSGYRDRQGSLLSQRDRGDWAAWISHRKSKAIEQAVNAARDWQKNWGQYEILVARVTEKVITPREWKVVSV